MAEEVTDLTLVKEEEPTSREIDIVALKIRGRGYEGNYGSPDSKVGVVEGLLAKYSPDLIVTPEYMFYSFGDNDGALRFEKTEEGDFEIIGGSEENRETVNRLKDLAAKHKSNMVVGTVLEATDIDGYKVYQNTALVINNEGKIVALRRKIHGSDAHNMEGGGGRMSEFYDLSKHSKLLIRPPETIEDSQQRALMRSIHQAVDSLEPVELQNKKGESFKLLPIICAERGHIPLDNLPHDGEIDVVTVVAREGDDHFTERSQLKLYGQIQDEKRKYLRDFLEEHEQRWDMGKLMKQMEEEKVTRKGSIWIAADSAQNGQVGVFSSVRDNIKDASFEDDALNCSCEI